MANSRKDHKGRKLREGESWRKDGRYSYRYTDIRSGKTSDSICKGFTGIKGKGKADCKRLGR